MKKNVLIPIIIAIVVIVGLAAALTRKNVKSTNTSNSTTRATNTDSSATKPDATSQNTIVLKNLDFMTKKLTIKKGETVTWKNEDTAKHTVTFDDEKMQSGSSQLFGPGESYNYTFNNVGTYSYHCTPHPFMKASIEVIE